MLWSAWEWIRLHFYKLLLSLVIILAALQYGLSVYEERMNGSGWQPYFSFNISHATVAFLRNASYSGLTGRKLWAEGSWALLFSNSNSNTNGSSIARASNVTSNDTTSTEEVVATVSYEFSIPTLFSSLPSLVNFTSSNVSILANSSLLSNTTSQVTSDNTSVVNGLMLCPEKSPLLVGPVNVLKESPSLEELERRLSPTLEAGGLYRPPDCYPRHKVAIVVPFRDRAHHLHLFLQHMHPFLQHQQVQYGIFVVEQAGNGPFNRAMLMNIGALEAFRQGDYQCVIFHDVDLLPENDHNVYSCPAQPRHMSVAVDIMSYKLPYEGLFGGVSALNKKHLELVNGFSNLFWGWGGEDDDMFNRLKFYNLSVSRYPPTVARYSMLTHKKAKPNPHRYRVMRNGALRSKLDGLNSLKYKRVDFVLKRLYTWILVDIRPGPGMGLPPVG